jgi:hypothetical protein
MEDVTRFVDGGANDHGIALPVIRDDLSHTLCSSC